MELSFVLQKEKPVGTSIQELLGAISQPRKVPYPPPYTVVTVRVKTEIVDQLNEIVRALAPVVKRRKVIECALEIGLPEVRKAISKLSRAA